MISAHFRDDLDDKKLRLNLDMAPDFLEGIIVTKLSDVTDALVALGPAQRL